MRSRGVLDRPVKPGDDSFVVAGVLPNPIFFLGAQATEAIQLLRVTTNKLDCFAEPVIGPRFAPTRWLAMTVWSARIIRLYDR
jgi:hypothetical protein